MARISLSPLIVDIRNKQADTVFSKWKGINYIRSRVVPSNPKTTAQTAIRNALKELVSLWQDAGVWISTNENHWAKGKDLSGFNRYIGKNVVDEKDGNLLNIADEVGGPALTAMSAAGGGAAGEIDVTFAATPLVADHMLEVMVRIAGSETWTKKVRSPKLQTSPYTITGLVSAQAYEVYAKIFNDVSPDTAANYGDDKSATATAT